METTKARWMQDSEGAWACFLAHPADAMQMVEAVEPGKSYDLTVKAMKGKRSLDANAYFWVLCGRLAEKMRIPKTDIYREYIREIGGNSETVCVLEKAAEKLRQGWERNGLGWVTDEMPSKLDGCRNVILYYGSSTYDTAQMSRLIDMVVQDCKAQGIETLTPEKLDAMKEAWR